MAQTSFHSFIILLLLLVILPRLQGFSLKTSLICGKVTSHVAVSCILLQYSMFTHRVNHLVCSQSIMHLPKSSQQPQQAWAAHLQRAHLQASGLGSRDPGGAAAPRAQHPSPLPRGPHGVPEGQISGPTSGPREIARSGCARQPQGEVAWALREQRQRERPGAFAPSH